MADNMKLVTKEYIDAIETDIENSKVGQKTPNGGEIFSTYVGENANKALSTASSAFGQNSIAGCMGFKVSGFNKGSDVTSPITPAYVTLNTDDEHFANISVGDICSVRINYNRSGLVVSSVDSETKTVTFTSSLGSFPDFNPSGEDYFWLVEKPESGDTLIGIGAFAGGFTGNHANQDGAFAIGRRNIADGRWSVALGSDNKAGYGSVAMGKGNNILLGESSAVFGQGNKVKVYDSSSLISGSNNTINQSSSSLITGSGNNINKTINACIVGGSVNTIEGLSRHIAIFGTDNNLNTGYCNLISGAGLKSNNKPCQTVIGCYNKETDALFALGVGTNDTDRRNAIEINRDGTGEIYTQGTTDKSIVQKQYVDNVKTDVTNLTNTVNSLSEQKLNKQTYTDGISRLYTASGDGTQGAVVIDRNNASQFSIPQRNTNGNIIINEPKSDNEATNKKYVDDKYTTLQNGITANETLIQKEIDERKAGDTLALQQLGYLENKLNDKVNKNSQAGLVYVSDQDEVLPYTEDSGVGSFPFRGASGTFSVAEPTEDSHVSTKKYVDDTIASQVSSVYKAKGSVADLSSLPTPDKAHEGFVYNIENEFTTTDLFVEGAGKTYPAGTNVVIVNTTGTTYKYDVLAGMVDLSSYATKTELSGKVDKVLKDHIVYANESTDVQKPITYTSDPTQYTIAYRSANGVVSVGTPTADTHATPKSYVDTADALKMNKSAFDYNETTKTLTIDIF